MLRTALRHLLVLLAAFGAYKVGRRFAPADVERARDNGERLWAAERWLRLPDEQSLQELVLRSEGLVRWVNGYYADVHFPLTAAVLVWLLLRRREHFAWAASALSLSMAAALVLHLTLPTAPPRLLDDHGIIDTGTAFGQSPYADPEKVGYAGQLLAVPSLHAGWSLLLAVVLVSACRTRWRWLWLLHPLITLLVIVVTGNHYWLDAAAGWAICVAALWVSQRWTLDQAPSREPEPAAVS